MPYLWLFGYGPAFMMWQVPVFDPAHFCVNEIVFFTTLFHTFIVSVVYHQGRLV
jgi:hypothetical protein